MTGAGEAGSTLNIFDSIALGAGVDVANITGVDGAVGATINSATTPILGGVEVLNYRATSNSINNNLAGGIAPDLTTLNYTSPVGNTAFTNIPVTVTTFGLSNVSLDNITADYTYAAGLRGTADAATLNLSNVLDEVNAPADVTISGLNGGGIEILNVNATGENILNSLTVDSTAFGDTLSTLNVGGTGSLVINAQFGFNGAIAVSTINASTNTGGLEMSVSGLGNLSFTGGAGNDLIGVDIANFNISDSINGGGGSNVLGLFSGANVTISAATTALNAAITATTNMQTLAIAGDGVAIDATVAANVLTQTQYAFFNTGNITVTAIAGDVITLEGNGNNGTVALTGSLGTTALTLNVVTANGQDAGALSLTTSGFTTIALNVDSDLSANAVVDITNFNIDSNTAVTATGDSDFSTIFVQGAGVGVIYNGSAATGIQDITGTARADSITGGANADFLVGGAGNDAIIAGASNDEITGGLGADTITTGAGQDFVFVTAGTAAVAPTADQRDSVLTSVTGALTAANLATFTRTWDIVNSDAGDIVVVSTGAAASSLLLDNVLTNNGTTAALMGATIAEGAAVYWNDGTNSYLVINSQESAVGDLDTIDVLDTMIVLTGVRTLSVTDVTVGVVNFSVVS